MIFADVALSRRLERAEAQSGLEFAEARVRSRSGEGNAAWMQHAGTVAMYDGPDSPINQTFCLGLFENPTSEGLEAIEKFFLDRGAPVTHEVSPYAGIATTDLLCARGYRPVELSSVMYQAVRSVSSGSDGAATVRVASPGEASLWADLSAEGWASDYPEMSETVREFGDVGFSRSSTTNFFAEIDGETGATGSLCLYEGVALFAGASTVPGFRRRGLQSALLKGRMEYAVKNACELAMMVTAVGSQSQRNAERSGFKIAYTRTKWQRTQ